VGFVQLFCLCFHLLRGDWRVAPDGVEESHLSRKEKTRQGGIPEIYTQDGKAIGAILLARSWVAWREGGARDAGYLIMEMRGSRGWACE
jgi:hypothetical protein